MRRQFESVATLRTSDASAGNRTRVTSMATMYSATRPLMLCRCGCNDSLTTLMQDFVRRSTPGQDRSFDAPTGRHVTEFGGKSLRYRSMQPGNQQTSHHILPFDLPTGSHGGELRGTTRPLAAYVPATRRPAASCRHPPASRSPARPPAARSPARPPGNHQNQPTTVRKI